MRYEGKLYRAINPIFAREPLSGRGAQMFGGRFNARGTAALYLAKSLRTAIREANQVGDLQPTTIVAYEAQIEGVFDGCDAVALATFGMTPDGLADPTWRDLMRKAGTSATQSFANRLMAEGFNGMLVRSFARGATGDDINMVLWNWGDAPPAMIRLIDDEGRLGRI